MLYFILLYFIILYCIISYCIVLFCIVLYCIALYCIVLYSILFYCFVLYRNLLYNILLFCILIFVLYYEVGTQQCILYTLTIPEQILKRLSSTAVVVRMNGLMSRFLSLVFTLILLQGLTTCHNSYFLKFNQNTSKNYFFKIFQIIYL